MNNGDVTANCCDLVGAVLRLPLRLGVLLDPWRGVVSHGSTAFLRYQFYGVDGKGFVLRACRVHIT